MRAFIANISHYGDVLAIPFFFALVVYFAGIKEKTHFEYILLAFSVAGLLFDVLFTLQFFSH
jgi:hypothetical protein